MAEVCEGKVYEVRGDKVRIQHLSGRGLSSSLISTNGRSVSIGDIVAFTVFEDGTGVILGGGAYGDGEGLSMSPLSNIELEDLLGA